jgi:hypothetical protein
MNEHNDLQPSPLEADGWREKECRVCRGHVHAKWHTLAQCELNPVALIQWLESRQLADVSLPVVRYILAVTGIDYAAMQRVLAEERRPLPPRPEQAK